MRAKRVLIVKLGAIGDVLMAVPAVDRLRRQLAAGIPAGAQQIVPGDVTDLGASIAVDWVIGRTAAPLLDCYTWIRPIAVDEAALLRGSLGQRWAALRALRRELRGRYDLIATLYYDPRYRLLTRTVRAGRRLSLSREDRARRILPGRHYTDELARILLGLPDECREGSLAPLPPERLPPSPLPPRVPGRRRLALVPAGASNMLRQQTLRRWPVERYAALAERLLARGDEVVLLGGPEDRWALPSFAHLVARSPIDAIGSLTLPEVVAACSTCDVVVSHDTGPLHLAALSTAAVVALFGPTDPASFLPCRPGVWGLWGGEGFACRPCYDGAAFAPCPSNGCMQQIEPQAVLRLLDRALATDAGDGPWPRLLVPSQVRDGGDAR